MATNKQELEGILEELGLQYKSHEDEEIIVPFHADKYLNLRGENTILIVIQLSEDGEYIKFFSPMAFKLDEGENIEQTLKALSIIAWKVLMVDFEYDYNDGEIRPTIDFPLEDANITSRQVHRCLTTIARVLDEFYEVVQHTIQTGELHSRLLENDLLAAMEELEESSMIDDPSDEEAQEALDELKGNLEELRGLLTKIEDEKPTNASTEAIEITPHSDIEPTKQSDDDFEWI